MRCWPGCLVIVLNAISEENIGAEVTVVELIPAGFVFQARDLKIYKTTVPKWEVEFKDGRYGLYSDQSLLPISPPADIAKDETAEILTDLILI